MLVPGRNDGNKGAMRVGHVATARRDGDFGCRCDARSNPQPSPPPSTTPNAAKRSQSMGHDEEEIFAGSHGDSIGEDDYLMITMCDEGNVCLCSRDENTS